MTIVKQLQRKDSTAVVQGTAFSDKNTDDYPFDQTPSNGASASSTANGIGPSEVNQEGGSHKTLKRFVFTKTKATVPEKSGTQLFRRRFWMLALFCCTSTLNAMQWIQYSVISNIIICYYQVDINAVNWTSLLYMVAYVPLVLPAAIYLDRCGLRTTLLTGSFLTLVSTVIQCFSQKTSGFPIALASQTVAAVAQVLILPLPPRVACAWFGPLEVCRATAVGVFGNQVGIALGFIFTPLMVPDDCSDKAAIRSSRSIVSYVLLACNTLVFILQYFTFQYKPPLPPSPVEARKDEVPKTNYKESILSLLKNVNFDLLLLSYGLLTGVFLALSTLLNEIIIPIFPDSLVAVGWMGLVIVLAGLFGSVLAGYILDRTHKFKHTSVAINICTLLCAAIFTGILYLKVLWAQFVVAACLGFFMTSYLSVGFEFAAEITFPESEGTSANLMNVSSMAFAAALVLIGSYLLENHGHLVVNLFFCGMVLVSCVVTASIKPELKRTQHNLENLEKPKKVSFSTDFMVSSKIKNCP